MPKVFDPVLICPVCGESGDFLSSRCGKCGAFTQERVPKVDLFESMYRIMEEPRRVFLTVARSEQKNYVYTLFAFTGFGLGALIFMAGLIGNLPVNFIFIFAIFVLGSPIAGLAIMTLAGLVVWQGNARIWRKRIPFRNSTAFLAYALIPVVLSVALVLPIELAIFGPYLFSDNPSPLVYKPTVFYILSGLDALAVIWSMLLYHKGFSSVYGISLPKNLLTILLACAVIFGAVAGSGHLLRALLGT
jgi:uncharacterized membrane protein YidH (DUF202 family)